MTQHRDTLAELRRGLEAVLDDAMHLDGAAFGKIRVAAPESGELEVQVHRGFSEDFIDTYRTISPHAPLPSARAARLRRRIALPDLTKAPANDPYVAASRGHGIRAMQSTPIVASQGRVVGTLSTHFTHPRHVSLSSAVALDHCARRAAHLIETLLPKLKFG